MVTVVDFAVRTNGDGEPYVVLILQGELTMVHSILSGRFYATVRRCSVSSTFTEEEAKSMVGKTLPGDIVYQKTEPYDYTVEDTGEVLKLAHRWAYSPEEPYGQQQAPMVPSPRPEHRENGIGQLVA